MKKIVSFCLICSMILCFVPVNSVSASVKDGYTLVPTAYGKTGVDVASSFVLTIPDTADMIDIADTSLSIDGQPQPDLEQKSEREFLVTPAAALSPNSLYIFRLKLHGKEDITWAFQTAKKFMITGNYPYNEATNVPKNCGIEILFSDEGFSSIEDVFAISPSVEGHFEYHKNTAVFVPKTLDYQTVYTVTIKAGISLGNTSETLTTDYVFAFETEAAPEYKQTDNNEYISFYSNYVELPSTENPKVSYGVYDRRSDPHQELSINVYKFSGTEQAVNAVKKINSSPYWAYYANDETPIDTKSLNKVMSFDVPIKQDRSYHETLELPDKLSPGFYLIDAVLGKSHEQMIIQISDLPVQVIGDQDKTIFWVNDISTGKSSAGATVYDHKENKSYKADENGIAVIDRSMAASGNERFTISSSSGKTCVWLYMPSYGYYYGGYGYYGYGSYGSANEEYWTMLQLDRTLFKRDDTVSFFGFAQSRQKDKEIKNVTAVLTQGGYYGYNSQRDVLHQQVIPVQNGTYTDQMRLPNLDAGSYCLSVYHDDIVLGSTYFTVQDYVKPPYKMEVTADKKAAFSGDIVTFSAKTGFFEGTPVSGLDISYRLSGYGLITSGNGQAKTDLEGKVWVSQEIVPQTDLQGQTNLSFAAEATLPEIGRTMASASVRIFVNDIDIKAEATRAGEKDAKERATEGNTGGKATIKVNVNGITLDRINNGDAAHYNDYLDKPVADQNLEVDIYRVYYIKAENGNYYDYIEKKTMPRYTYTRKEEKIESFSMTTNQDGLAEKSFAIPDHVRESYYAKITGMDGNRRLISKNIYIGYDYREYYQNASTNEYYLDGAKDSYDIGETVNLTLKRGTDTVTKGSFLFVAMQNGIKSYQAGQNPYTFRFSKEQTPNVIINAYYFNGVNYQSGYYLSKNIRFDYTKMDLTLTAVTDKIAYKPGDMCTITVTAKDEKGAPKEADVNISIVDEGLFALREYNVDTLTSLYGTMGSGLRFAAATHGTAQAGDDVISEEAPMVAAGLAKSESAERDSAESESDSETYLREIFKDTAFFHTIQTDKNGVGSFSFQLPDNITSWRLTMSGVSNDLYAGNGVQNITVTNPMFLSYTLNDEFLIGDNPVIGVNVYGTSLTGGETVHFEVWDESAPDVKYKAGGVSFERVNIPLWEMKNEGSNSLIIKATLGDGRSDSVKHGYQVFKTYRELDTAAYYDVTVNTVFDVGSGGLTSITFTDQGKGAFLCELLNMRYVYGDRIEKLLVRREAGRLIEEHFPDLDLYNSKEDFDPKFYQREDGGIAILPHAESDLKTTVKLMAYIKDEINTYALKNYLYGLYEGENAENKMCALYGLAMLQEPVLLDLEDYSLIDGLSVLDTVYIALGYWALGEKETASDLYDSKIAPELERITPYYRVNTGRDQDDILEVTSATNILATKLEKPEKEGLYQYCIQNHATDILLNMEKLSYIEHEMVRRTGDDEGKERTGIGSSFEAGGSITYTLFGEKQTRELKYGGSYTLRIPTQSMSQFKLLEVTGQIGAVSLYQKPLEEEGTVDDQIIVRRRYYKANESSNSTNTFEQGDLVRVQIWIDYSAKAIDGSYCITDFLPSGLEYAGNSAKISGTSNWGAGYFRYCTVEGQKVKFYDYNGRFDKGYLYYYYARVVSPGTFKAEGCLVQNLTAKDYFTVGEDSVVVISAP